MNDFVRALIAALRDAGHDPERIPPVVVLERPLWAAELAWLADRLPRA